MTKTVTAYEARTNLGELLNEVYYKGVEIIIKKSGKPVARISRINESLPKKLKNKRPLQRCISTNLQGPKGSSFQSFKTQISKS